MCSEKKPNVVYKIRLSKSAKCFELQPLEQRIVKVSNKMTYFSHF